MAHLHARLIDQVGGNSVVAEHFGVSNQAVTNWRNRGIPLDRRAGFAALWNIVRVNLPRNFLSEEREDAGRRRTADGPEPSD